MHGDPLPRRHPALRDHGPKYLNSPATPLFDKSRTLYLIDRAKATIRRTGQAVIVEGYTDALMAHQVLFFRDQQLSLEEHKAFGRLFGELAIHPNTPGPEGHPEILPIHADANSKRIAGERFSAWLARVAP